MPGGILIAGLSPPGIDSVERVASIPDIQKSSSVHHPGKHSGIDVRGLRFYILVAEDQNLQRIQISCKPPYIVKLHRPHRKAVFQQRQRHAVKLGERIALDKIEQQRFILPDFLHQCLRRFFIHRISRIFVLCHGKPISQLSAVYNAVREGPLEQAAVRHTYPHRIPRAFEIEFFLFHIAEQLEHAGKQSGIASGNRPGLIRLVAGLILLRNIGLEPGIPAVEYPVRPGADLIMPDMRMQQGRRRSLPVIVLIIFPCIGRQILNGIIQEPHPAPGSLHQLLHDSIFQIGGFKGTLLVYPLVYVGLPARARPNLCDVAVHRGNVDECSLRAHDFPLGIIQQAVCRHIKPKIPVIDHLRVFLQRRAHTVYRPAVKISLQPG